MIVNPIRPCISNLSRICSVCVTALTSGCDSVEAALVHLAEVNGGHTRSLLVTRGHPKTLVNKWSSGEEFSHPKSS